MAWGVVAFYFVVLLAGRPSSEYPRFILLHEEGHRSEVGLNRSRVDGVMANAICREVNEVDLAKRGLWLVPSAQNHKTWVTLALTLPEGARHSARPDANHVMHQRD